MGDYEYNVEINGEELDDVIHAEVDVTEPEVRIDRDGERVKKGEMNIRIVTEP